MVVSGTLSGLTGAGADADVSATLSEACLFVNRAGQEYSRPAHRVRNNPMERNY